MDFDRNVVVEGDEIRVFIENKGVKIERPGWYKYWTGEKYQITYANKGSVIVVAPSDEDRCLIRFATPNEVIKHADR